MNLLLKFLFLMINLFLLGLLLTMADGFYSIVNIKLSKVAPYFDQMMINFPNLVSHSPILISLLFIALIFIKGLGSWHIKNQTRDSKNHPAIRTVYYDRVQAISDELITLDGETFDKIKKENFTRRKGNKERIEKYSRDSEENAWEESPGKMKNPFSQLDSLD